MRLHAARAAARSPAGDRLAAPAAPAVPPPPTVGPPIPETTRARAQVDLPRVFVPLVREVVVEVPLLLRFQLDPEAEDAEDVVPVTSGTAGRAPLVVPLAVVVVTGLLLSAVPAGALPLANPFAAVAPEFTAVVVLALVPAPAVVTEVWSGNACRSVGAIGVHGSDIKIYRARLR